jgi:catecholate siderophore receptor
MLLSIVSLLASTAAPVSDTLSAAVPEFEGQTVTVRGKRGDYGVDQTSGATRTPTPLKDVPQAVTAVTERQIEDRNFRSVGDVLRAVPGATVAQGEGHRDQVVLRGTNSTADFFVDGLRDDAQYYRPLYNVDRIEVLRGPNAMTFGRGGGGGVVNRVIKRPGGDTFAQATGSVDTFGAWAVDADVNLPVAKGVAARLNATREEFANHRQVFEGQLTAVNPTLRFDLGSAAALTLSYEHVEDDRVVDRGVPSLGGRPLAGFRDTFFGNASVNRMGLNADLARAALDVTLASGLTLTGRVLWADYDKFYSNVYPAAAVAGSAGARTLDVESYFDALQRRNLLGQVDLVWRTTTGPAVHTVLLGVEAGGQRTRSDRLNGFFDGVAGATMGGRRVTAPLTDPFSVPAPVFRRGTGERSTRTEADIRSVLLQDQMRIGPVELLAGVRYDRFELDSVNLFTGQRLTRSDDLWSPRLGLVLHPVSPVSLYLSYSRSYLPQSGDQFTSLDLSTAALEPERFDNVEAGVKWTPREGLLVAAAVYQLDRVNTRAAGPNPGEVVLTGAQRSRGIELEATGRIARDLTLSLAAALQEAEIRRTTTAAPAGRDVALVPQAQFSAWGRWDASRTLGLGLGVEHRSSQFASISNAVRLPAYTRVDAAAFVRLTDRIEAQVNVDNLLGETYFPTAHTDNNITTGAPTNARVTLRMRW